MKIVMVDQDGVVCGNDYQPTADISGLVAELLKTGDIFIVPNSDTPLPRLKENFREMIGLNNPAITIAERGAVVEIKGRKGYTKGIVGIEEFLFKIQKSFEEENYCVEIGDSATWLREGKKFQPNSRILIIDGLREQTISMYFKRTDGHGFAFTDPDFALRGLEIINSFALPEGLSDPDYNAKYGIAICNASGIDKTSGYRLVRNRYPVTDFYMIGDSDSDIIFDDKVIHCAVGNGSPKLKEKSAFVSNRPLTEGLGDCLKWICH